MTCSYQHLRCEIAPLHNSCGLAAAAGLMVTNRTECFNWCFKVIISTQWSAPAWCWRLLQSWLLKWWEFIQGVTSFKTGAGRPCRGQVAGLGQEVGQEMSSSKLREVGRGMQLQSQCWKWGSLRRWERMSGGWWCREMEAELFQVLCGNFCTLHLQRTQVWGICWWQSCREKLWCVICKRA